MIYSVDLDKMAGRIAYIELCKYVSDLGWKKYSGKVMSGLAVYHKYHLDTLFQITVPCDREFEDYALAMRKVIATLSITEGKSEEQLILELLNPLSDILRVRHISPDVENGSILFEDAINLFENSKKLLLNAALDSSIGSYKKIYRGRPPEDVQQFINHCRYGQTEIGSYVISLVCPFVTFDQGQLQQLTLFSEEENASVSITRRATKKLVESLSEIKQAVEDGGDLSEIIEDPEKNISVSFIESITNLNIEKANNSLEIKAKWAPTINSNRPGVDKIQLSHDHYSPLKSIVDKYKKEDETVSQTFEGRISKLYASPNLEDREKGRATLVYINQLNKTSSVNLLLSKVDYDIAISAHSEGRTIRAIGEVSGKNMVVNTLEIL